ncbi:hypothetical protein Aduo_008691 [Ancylostoma duodenale]
MKLTTSTVDIHLLSDLKQAGNLSLLRFPVGVPVTDSIYIPKGSRVEPSLLHDDYGLRIIQSDEDAYHVPKSLQG